MNKNNEEQTIFVGYIGVDSGCIIVADPCYLVGDSWNEEDFEKEIVGKTISGEFNADKPIQIKNKNGSYKAIASNSGFGDGVYPVYATIQEGRIKKIEVVFFD